MSSTSTPTYSALAQVARRSAWAISWQRFFSAVAVSRRSLMPQVKPLPCRKMVHSRLKLLSRSPAVLPP